RSTATQPLRANRLQPGWVRLLSFFPFPRFDIPKGKSTARTGATAMFRHTWLKNITSLFGQPPGRQRHHRKAYRPRIETREDRPLPTAGALDPSFGVGGLVTTDIQNSNEFFPSLAIDSNGGIVVAGTTSSSTADFAVVRYNSDGSLDTSFG